MRDRIDNASLALQRAGLGPGERVAIWADNSPAAICLTVACWRLGAVTLPLSTRLTASQANDIIERMGCHRVVSDRALDREMLALRPLVPQGIPSWHGVCLDDLDLDLDTAGTIVMTSGSTGRPKGVLHALGSHAASARGAHENIPFGRDDTWLVSLPMYHMGGLALIMRSLLHGGALAFPDPGESLPAALRRTGATHLSLVPTQLRHLLSEPDPVSLRALLVGGAACPPARVLQAADAGLPIYLTYGSTEMGSQVATTARGEALQEPTCSGRVLSQRELKVNAHGEILVRGATRFTGYVTAAGLEAPFDAQGWFATGDMGTRDPSGRLYVQGRRDTMFISGGENIYPEEIERALLERLPATACVVVPVSDEQYGQRPVAFVHMDEPLPTRDDLALNLERFKWPDRLYPWPAAVDHSVKPERPLFAKLAAAQG